MPFGPQVRGKEAALGYLPVVRLGLGSVDEPLPYLAQMGSWVTGGDWTDRQGRSYRTGLSRVKVPILSVAGSGDVLLAHAQAAEFRLKGKQR